MKTVFRSTQILLLIFVSIHLGNTAAFAVQDTTAISDEKSEGASELFAGDQWDPETFVDLCEQSTRDSSLIDVTHQLARVEWQTLFDYSLPG